MTRTGHLNRSETNASSESLLGNEAAATIAPIVGVGGTVMIWRWGVMVAIGLIFTGCSASVGGIVGDEKFTGSVQQGMGGGSMELQSAQGTKCFGRYAALSPTGGAGSLSCNDGRRASIQYTTTSIGVGYGYGMTNTGAPVRFYFGMDPEQGAQYIAPPGQAGGSTGGRTRNSTGTGFFVTHQGHVVTNAHVVDGCSGISVQQQGAGASDGQIAAIDKQNDLALLRTDIRPGATAALRGSRPVRVGESIVAYGFPLNGLVSSGGVLTTGTLNALTGMRDDTRYYQISAPLQPGNSGGPLMDATGTVIGVNSATLGTRAARVIGTMPQNVNFAIKSEILRTFLSSSSVTVETGGSKDLAVPDIGERARGFTVLIKCQS